jgi:DNA invertase Pin-like site-specific DNA recombinase
MGAAVGYVRQSRRADEDKSLSHDSQVAAIRRMAAQDGLDPDKVQILDADMGRSGGRGKERFRADYQRLLTLMEAGAIDTVYAISLTRLGRSMTELMRVADLADDKGIRLVFDKEGVMDPHTMAGQTQLGMFALLAQVERTMAVERAKDNVAMRRSRGQRMGRIPYGTNCPEPCGKDHRHRVGEDPQAVVEAFRVTRSLNGAALALNAQGVASALGRGWSATAIRDIVSRYAPDLLPRRASRGAKPSSPFALYRLVTCHCGRVLTGGRDSRPGHSAVYRCHYADTDPNHRRPHRITESVLMGWIRAEAELLVMPTAIEVERNEKRHAALMDKRARVIDFGASGFIDKAEVARRLAEVDAELVEVEAETTVESLPSRIDWTWAARDINRVLGALFSKVVMAEDFQSVSFEWRVPEWRSEPVAATA